MVNSNHRCQKIICRNSWTSHSLFSFIFHLCCLMHFPLSLGWILPFFI